MRRRDVFSGLLTILIVLAGFSSSPAMAQSEGQSETTSTARVGSSGLPIPRFVSLKSARVNMRVGPGTNYAVEWMYLKSGLPVEIIQEFDNWRRIRDVDGTEGWVNQALLSGTRMAIIAPWLQGKETSLPLLASKQNSSRRVAQVEPGAVGGVEECDGTWCRMRFSGHIGWIEQALIWGVYPDEELD